MANQLIVGKLNTDRTIVQEIFVDSNGAVLTTASGTGASAGQVQGTAADGATASGNPVQIAGKDGSGNIQTVSTDTAGNVNTVAKPTTGAAPSNAVTTAYASSLIVKTSAGTVWGVAGYNSGPAQFLQFHDATAVPANGVAPVGPLVAIAAASNFSIDFGKYGMGFTTGIVIVNSTTGPTKTLGAADCWIAVRYS